MIIPFDQAAVVIIFSFEVAIVLKLDEVHNFTSKYQINDIDLIHQTTLSSKTQKSAQLIEKIS